jgi:hypothetical protein
MLLVEGFIATDVIEVSVVMCGSKTEFFIKEVP